MQNLKSIKCSYSFAKGVRIQKYRLLRYFPGKIGNYYSSKYDRQALSKKFDKALLETVGMTCIDLGAHIGRYTEKMAKYAGKVIAFEPDPKSYRLLKRRTRYLNNVITENKAVGVEDDFVSLFQLPQPEHLQSQGSIGNTVVSTSSKTNLAESIIQVTQIDFIGYLQQLNEDIGVLKIDIEGAETELLEHLFKRGDLVNRIKFIFVETHERSNPSHKYRLSELRQSSNQFINTHIDFDWY